MITRKYTPITQEPYCCLAACLQMVLLRHSLPLIDQKTLAVMMGLTVPEKDKKLFPKAKAAKGPPFGTIIKTDSMMPQAVFRKLGIPLSVELRLENEFDDNSAIREYIIGQLEANHDVIVNLDTRTLNKTKESFGHSLLVELYDASDDKARLIDPSADQPRQRSISIAILAFAIRQYGAKNWGGFWEVKRV